MLMKERQSATQPWFTPQGCQDSLLEVRSLIFWRLSVLFVDNFPSDSNPQWREEADQRYCKQSVRHSKPGQCRDSFKAWGLRSHFPQKKSGLVLRLKGGGNPNLAFLWGNSISMLWMCSYVTPRIDILSSGLWVVICIADWGRSAHSLHCGW